MNPFIKEELDDGTFDVKIKFDVIPFIIIEELDDAALNVKIEWGVNPFPMEGINEVLITEKGTNIIFDNDSKEEITIKEEPLQDDLVSLCLNKVCKHCLTGYR